MRPNSRVVNTAEGDLLVLTAASLRSPKARKLQDVGVEVVRTKSKKGRMDLPAILDRKSTRLNSSHGYISYAVFCLKKKKEPREKGLKCFRIAITRRAHH